MAVALEVMVIIVRVETSCCARKAGEEATLVTAHVKDHAWGPKHIHNMGRRKHE